MKPVLKFQDPEWWFWAVILVAIGIGLVGFGWGYTLCLAVSVLNLAVYSVLDRSLTTLRVQVRLVWLGLVLIAAYVAGFGWLFYLLFIGMVLVVVFDRCSIELVLKKMPWNQTLAS